MDSKLRAIESEVMALFERKQWLSENGSQF